MRASPHQARAKFESSFKAALNSFSDGVKSPRRNRTSPRNSWTAAEAGASPRACSASFQAVATPSLSKALRPRFRVASGEAADAEIEPHWRSAGARKADKAAMDRIVRKEPLSRVDEMPRYY